MSGAAPARRPQLRAWHWLAAAALVVSGVIAGDYWRSRRDAEVVGPGAPIDPATLRPGFGPPTYAEALTRADQGVESMRERLARHPGDWLPMEGLARALVARFRLTASAAHLAEADRTLDRALALAPWPAGPALSRAAVSLVRHDLDGATGALRRFDASAVPPPIEERLEAQSIRCEIAFERGRLAEARKLCATGDDLGLTLRRANIAARTGDSAQAVPIIEDLLRTPRLPPSTLAMLALQRASVALAAGDWRASGRWARAAERAFPGYWLAEAYVAQQFALEGDLAEARRRYAVLATRTGDPEVLDALAWLTDSGGRAAEAREWAAKASVAWQSRNRFLPDAYVSHYAEHLLRYGDSRQALALAEADHRRRPFAATISHYAFALWRNDEPARALAFLRQGEAGGFLTADMKLTEALALSALGRGPEADAALAEARRLNPRVDDPRAQFIAFQQD
jgi:tetratricopeptide (TPR) repeat protein